MTDRIRLRFARASFLLDVDLALPAAGITAVLGPSGCGKTTLLRCVAGLEKAEGVVEVHGERWQDSGAGIFLPTWQRPLGYVFQEASLFDHLDVARNLAYAQRRGGSGEVGGLGLETAIGLLGIGHLLARKPGELSGGERQRVAIARALATQPRLLLLDEPLAALDAARRREILPWLERLREQARLPMLYVTHAVDEAARLADHLVIMDQGQVRASGPPEETMARLDIPMAQEDDAGALLSAIITVRDEQWKLARADFDGGSLWFRDDGLPAGTAVRLRALARDVSLAEQPPQRSSIQNVLDCEVEDVVAGAHPSQVMVRLRCGSARVLARITARAAAVLGIEPGKRVWAQVKAVSVVG